jgi:HSP20 family protein
MSKDKEKKSESAAPQGSATESQATGRPNGRGTDIARRESSAPTWWGGDPFTLMHRFADEMDRVFEDFGVGRGLMTGWPFGGRRGLSPRGAGLDLATWSPQVEVFQREDRLVIRADLPGLSKDDVQVEVTDDAVTIRGERRQEHEERREGYYHSERSYGSFYRSIPLPEGVAAEQADANFHDGVLEITMPAPPQREASRGRRLEVKG